MSGRQVNAEAYNWAHHQASPPQPSGPLSNDPSGLHQVPISVQQHQNRHMQASPGSHHFRDHPLPSPNSSAYGTSYLQARPLPSASTNMNYGLNASMPGHHIQDPAGPASSGYAAQPPIGQYGTAFAYGSHSFYGGPQGAQQHPEAMAQQPYYASHHGGAGPMDPNVHTHSLYGSPAHMDANMVGPNGPFHHEEAGMMGPGAYSGLHGVGIRPKRKQVKNACINCQKACKKCDEGRPCGRCVKYGLTDTCQDSARKERRRGVKRGPYKRRATTGSQPASGVGVGMPSSSVHGRTSHLTSGGRSMDGISSAPDETQLSSPGFGGHMISPRPPLPLGMQSSMTSSWHSASSPSMRSVEEDRDGRFGRNMGGASLGPNSYYTGYEGQEAGPSPYDRSSSAPVPGPGSLVLSPIGSLSRLQPPAAGSQGSGLQLPSLMSSASSSNLNGFYNQSASRPLASPSLHPGVSGSFLSASTPQTISHNRLHSEGSFGNNSLNSAGTSASTMSPRTPLNGQGADYQLMSPPGNGKFPTTYVPPQPTVPSTSSTFLSQDTARPFPLKMPKALQRGRSGTASSFLEAQTSRPKHDYESNHFDNGSSLAPIRREASPPGGPRSSPYLGTSGHHVHTPGGSTAEDMSIRRMGSSGTGLTPRIELSSYPTPMSMSSGAGAGGIGKREADVPGSLGLA